MKIHILYRHYNVEGAGNKSRPSWFDYEKCFVNLLNTIEGKNVNLHVIMDGDSTGNFIENYKDKYTLHSINVRGDYNSYLETYKYIKTLNIDDNDLIYFLENDYLHTDNWVEEIVTLFQTYPQGLNYVSLYDHNDKYFLPMYDNLVSKIFTTETRHWRTTPSTCGSYIIPKNIFIEDEDINTGGPGDHDKFLHLNSTKNRFVLTPIPGLSTHCMEGLLSPTIDWKQINNK
jgi:uncharacterized protein (DUF927 family)